jgi:hypothetical protein
MIGCYTDAAQTKRMIEMIWLAQDIDNTIEAARREMSAADFDWRPLGLTREPSWADIRRAMLRWAIDQQLYQHDGANGGKHGERLRDGATSGSGPVRRRTGNYSDPSRRMAVAV